MKTLIKSVALFSLALAVFTNPVYSQDSKDTAVQKGIDLRHFVFKAQSALPLRGAVRNLTSEYDMRVIGDSIVTYLPYFGRAYVAPIDPTQGALQFTSTDFSYTSKKKKNGWDITIVPKDNKEVRQLYLSVSTKGYARLQVLSNNRDPISFNGYVDPLKQETPSNR